MMIDKITLTQNKYLKRLNTQLNEPTNQNSRKSSKIFGQRIRKRYYKTLGTKVQCT